MDRILFSPAFITFSVTALIIPMAFVATRGHGFHSAKLSFNARAKPVQVSSVTLSKPQKIGPLVEAKRIQSPQVKTNSKIVSATAIILEAIPAFSINQPVSNILAEIAYCESRLNPKAKNPNSSAKGLLQIIDSTWREFGCTGNVYDPDDNFSCGLKIATESGFHHWNASKSCWQGEVTLPQKTAYSN
jgi:hypothetical protein